MVRSFFLMLAAALLILILTLSVSAQVDFFAIAYGATISDGVPVLGAGNLENGGNQDVYTFEGNLGDVVILDAVSGYAGDFRWSMTAPDGSVLFNGLYVDLQGTLSFNGIYTITVYGASAAFTGTYSFRLLLAPPPQIFSVTIGDTIAESIPASGAGNLETVGSLDLYRFDGTAGEEVLFDVISGSSGTFRWKLEAPDGTSLFNAAYLDRQVTLPQTGAYTLTVYGYVYTNFGVYSFRLVQVSAPQEFTIAIGDTVSDGIPAAGAGNLEAAGSTDVYRFDATAGQEIVLDTLIGSAGTFLWKLDAPNGTELFDDLYIDHQVILPQTGTYTLTVRGYALTSVGVYSFQLVPVSAPHEFTIAIGDTVSNGVPGAGAGNLETAGSMDFYRFDAATGQEIILDTLIGDAGTFLWKLDAPDGTELFDNLYTDHQVILPQTGTYTLTVRGYSYTSVGVYAFRLFEVPAPQHFTISIGDTVSLDVPAAGAGHLESRGAVDIYTFDGTAGQDVLFEVLLTTATLGWRLQAPDSTPLFDQIYEDTQISMPQTGTYTLTIYGIGTQGLYSFALLPETSTATPTLTSTGTATATHTPTVTATETATMTTTATTSETATATATETATHTPTATTSETATATATATETATMTPTATTSETATATATETATHTPTATTSETAAYMPTGTAVPTLTAPMLPPPPPVPLCAGANYDAQGVVRSNLPDALRHAIHCGVLYQNGQAVTWEGQTLYSEATLGAAGLLELGVQQAVDIFSPSGVTYFEGGGVFCLRGEGTLIWLAASGTPRRAEIIGSYTVPEFPGFTCTTLFEPGTVISVIRNPLE